MAETKLVKTIPLDDEQYRELRGIFSGRSVRTSALATILEEIISRQTEREAVAWDELWRLAGYASEMAGHADGKHIGISWLGRCVEIHERTSTGED